MIWLLLTLFACSTSCNEKPIEKTEVKKEVDALAEIDGEAITKKDLSRFTMQFPPKSNDGIYTNEEKQALINKLIDRRLILKAAIESGTHRDLRIRKRLKQLLTQKEVRQKVNQLQFSDEELQNAYETHKTSIDKEGKGFDATKSKVLRKLKSLKSTELAAALTARLKVDAKIELADDRYDDNATGPIATVNGSEISRLDFNRVSERMPTGNDGWSKAEKKKLIDRLVEDELFYLEAMKLELYKDAKTAQSIINHYLQQRIVDNIPQSEISEEKLMALYEKGKEKNAKPEMIDISRIVVLEEAKAIKLAAELKKNPDKFNAKAELHTLERERSTAGKIGWIGAKGRGDITSKVAQAGFSLKDNTVSDPINSPIGWQIIKRIAYKEKEIKSFESVKNRLKQRLIAKYGKDQALKLVEELRSKAKIIIDNDNLDAMELKGPIKRNVGALDAKNFKKMNLKK